MRMWSILKKLIKLEIKRLFNKSFNLVLLMMLAIVLLNVILNYDEIRSRVIKPSIAVVVEDESMEVNLLVNSITKTSMGDKLSFEHLSYESALDGLKKNQLLAIIHIEKGVGETINRAEPVTINLLVDQQKDLRVNFLREYIENLTNMLNEGQNGAMIYYQLLKDKGISYDDRIDELNQLAFKYTTTFLARQQVFDQEEPVEPFMGAKFVEYYLITVQLLFITYTIIMFYYIFEDDLRYKRIERLFLSGYSMTEILLSKLIAQWMFTLPIILLIQGLTGYVMGGIDTVEMIKNLMLLTLVHMIIQFWVIVAHLSIKKTVMRDGVMIFIPVILAVSGGLFIPLNGMPEIFKLGAYKNIYYLMQQGLLGKGLRIEGYIAIAFMAIFPLYLIYRISKERNYVFF
ncbi:MAG: ABC transporter permease [Clostridiales bacterium]|nr:ABC transporter permease [Clostridiales bacterium]